MYLPFSTCSQQPHAYFLGPTPFASLSPHDPPYQNRETVQLLIQNNQALQLQIKQIKSTMTGMQQEIMELRQLLQSKLQYKGTLVHNATENEEQSRKGKFYSKDKECLIEGCTRKYSSKIALNSHLRKVHRIFKPPRSKLT